MKNQKLIRIIFPYLIYRKSDSEKALLFNAYRLGIVSNQKNYFYEQKEHYVNEIERVTIKYDKIRNKKKSYKKQYIDTKKEGDANVIRYEKEIKFLRDKVNKIFLFNYYF